MRLRKLLKDMCAIQYWIFFFIDTFFTFRRSEGVLSIFSSFLEQNWYFERNDLAYSCKPFGKIPNLARSIFVLMIGHTVTN